MDQTCGDYVRGPDFWGDYVRGLDFLGTTLEDQISGGLC